MLEDAIADEQGMNEPRDSPSKNKRNVKPESPMLKTAISTKNTSDSKKMAGRGVDKFLSQSGEPISILGSNQKSVTRNKPQV